MKNKGKKKANDIGIVGDLLELRKIEKKLLVKALRDLVFMARTSGGVAGPDKGLMQACDFAEGLLNDLSEKPTYFMATENGIADIDIPLSDN